MFSKYAADIPLLTHSLSAHPAVRTYAFVLSLVFIFAIPWERSFWMSLLAVWVIGASTLTWEHRKSTWLFLGLVAVSAALARERDDAVAAFTAFARTTRHLRTGIAAAASAALVLLAPTTHLKAANGRPAGSAESGTGAGPATAAGGGVPFGASKLPSALYGEPFTETKLEVSPDSILSTLREARVGGGARVPHPCGAAAALPELR